MRFFFRSRQFKIILLIISVALILSLSFFFGGSRMTPFSDVAGVITAPIREGVTAISNSVKDFITAYNSGSEIMVKNTELTSELNELREKLANYHKAISENEFYKDYLGIKEQNPDFNFAPATLISKDSDDPFGGFVINKGSAAGISVYDPVITDEGLVGYITELGTTTAKVATILNPNMTLGALDSRTDDSGIIKGTVQLANESKCRFANLARSCSVAIGDFVVTSGEGIFPDGLLIGSISYIGTDEYNNSINADIIPFVDFSSIRKVMVITSFEGQGGIIPSEDK